MKDQTRSELKQLPYMLGKLLGGFLAVIGFGAAVYVHTHGAGPSLICVLLYLLTGIAGLAIFIVSSRLLAKKAKDA